MRLCRRAFRLDLNQRHLLSQSSTTGLRYDAPTSLCYHCAGSGAKVIFLKPHRCERISVSCSTSNVRYSSFMSAVWCTVGLPERGIIRHFTIGGMVENPLDCAICQPFRELRAVVLLDICWNPVILNRLTSGVYKVVVGIGSRRDRRCNDRQVLDCPYAGNQGEHVGEKRIVCLFRAGSNSFKPPRQSAGLSPVNSPRAFA